MNWYKIAKTIISPKDAKLLDLVKKMIGGNKDWTQEELQLYQNHSDIVEDMLKKHIA
jgi:hypothetical protein